MSDFDWVSISHAIKQPEIFAEFQTFVPVVPLILHYAFVVNMTSDCNEFNSGFGWMYIVGAHLSVFGSRFAYYMIRNGFSFRTSGLRYVAIKSLLVTVNFSAWTLVRAKPYKCLLDFTPMVSVGYFLLVQFGLLVVSRYIVHRCFESEEIKKIFENINPPV